MIENIIIDLDGPILDGKLRHYQCYRSILLEQGYTPMPVEQYWEMKRNRLSRRYQLATTDAVAIYDYFLTRWLEQIETPEMLALDKIQPGAIEKLHEWQDMGFHIILATMRQYSERLQNQLNSLKLTRFIKRIVVSDHCQGGEGKALRVKEVVPDFSAKQSLWIGDSEVDIEAARTLGCSIWAVTCGVRNENFLKSLSPDFLSQSLRDIKVEVFP